MKLLLDACVWGKAATELRTGGHDVVWVGDWAEDPGDESLLVFARNEQRILITLDKDFGELAILRGIRHHGILRLVNIPARVQANACEQVLRTHAIDLVAGALITVEPGRLRIRPPTAET
jgi:predicted nuclease of predicted toxin-antitoxin system